MDTSTLEATVVEACAAHEAANWNKFDYRACVYIEDKYFVKFGPAVNLEPERATQEHVFAHAQASPSAPRVPRIVHAFTRDVKLYVVMDRIRLATRNPAGLADSVQAAIVWLSTVPPASPDHRIGPLAGGRIRHQFFQDGKAPMNFADVKALNAYVAKAYEKLPKVNKKGLLPVDVSGDRLMFAQADVRPCNFGVDESGRPVLLDFGEVGLLPESFVAFTLHAARLHTVAAALSVAENPNVKTMFRIAWFLGMKADVLFGM